MTVRRTRWWLGYGQWWYAEAEDWTPDFWEETWIPLGEGKGSAAEGKGKASWGKGRPAAKGKGIAPGSASAVAGGKGNASWGQGLASWGKGKGKAAEGKGNASWGKGKAAAEGKGNAPGSATAVAGGKGNAAEGKGNAPGSASAVAWGKGKAAAEGKGNAAEGKGNAAEGNSNRQNQQWAQWAQWLQAETTPRLRWARAVTDDWAPAKRQRTTTEWLRPQNQAASSTDDWYAEDGGDVTQTECQRLAQLREDAKRGRRARSLANFTGNLAHRLTCVPAITMQQLEDHIFDWAIFPEDSDSDPEDYLDDDDPGPPVLSAEHDGAGLVERPQPDDEPAP